MISLFISLQQCNSFFAYSQILMVFVFLLESTVGCSQAFCTCAFFFLLLLLFSTLAFMVLWCIKILSAKPIWQESKPVYQVQTTWHYTWAGNFKTQHVVRAQLIPVPVRDLEMKIQNFNHCICIRGHRKIHSNSNKILNTCISENTGPAFWTTAYASQDT